VGSGVVDEVPDAEPVAAADLVAQGVDRLPSQRGRGRGEVDQVRGVRRDVRELRPSHGSAEVAGLAVLDLLADPAIVVLDEDLNRPAAGVDAALDGPGRASGDRLVGAEGRSIDEVTGDGSERTRD
jgi:hypothetical protein